jgi:hypothetical protein
MVIWIIALLLTGKRSQSYVIRYLRDFTFETMRVAMTTSSIACWRGATQKR